MDGDQHADLYDFAVQISGSPKRQVAVDNGDLQRRLELAESTAAELTKVNETLKRRVSELSSQLYTVWLTARKELDSKDAENDHLNKELLSYRIVSCPSCKKEFRSRKSGPPKPQYHKVIKAKNTVELQFYNYEQLQRWVKDVGLTKNSDQLPVLPEELDSMSMLKESKSLLEVARNVLGDRLITSLATIPASSPSESSCRPARHRENVGQQRDLVKSSLTSAPSCSGQPKGLANSKEIRPTDESSMDLVKYIDTTRSALGPTYNKKLTNGHHQSNELPQILQSAEQPFTGSRRIFDADEKRRTRSRSQNREGSCSSQPRKSSRNESSTKRNSPETRRSVEAPNNATPSVTRGKKQREEKPFRKSPRKTSSSSRDKIGAPAKKCSEPRNVDKKAGGQRHLDRSKSSTAKDRNGEGSGRSSRRTSTDKTEDKMVLVKEICNKIMTADRSAEKKMVHTGAAREEGKISSDVAIGCSAPPVARSSRYIPLPITSDAAATISATTKLVKLAASDVMSVLPTKKTTVNQLKTVPTTAREIPVPPSASVTPSNRPATEEKILPTTVSSSIQKEPVNVSGLAMSHLREWVPYCSPLLSPLPHTPKKLASPLVNTGNRISQQFSPMSMLEDQYAFKSPTTSPLKSLPIKKRLEMFRHGESLAADGTTSSMMSCGKAAMFLKEWMEDNDIPSSMCGSFTCSPIKIQSKSVPSKETGTETQRRSYPIDETNFQRLLDEERMHIDSNAQVISKSDDVFPMSSGFCYPHAIDNGQSSSSSLMVECGSFDIPPKLAQPAVASLENTVAYREVPTDLAATDWNNSSRKSHLSRSRLSDGWQHVQLNSEVGGVPVVQVVSDVSDDGDIPLSEVKKKLSSSGTPGYATPHSPHINMGTGRGSTGEPTSSTPRRSPRKHISVSRDCFGHIPTSSESPVELDDIQPSLSAQDVDLSTDVSLSPLKSPVKQARKRRRKRLLLKKTHKNESANASKSSTVSTPLDTPTKKPVRLYCGKGLGKAGKKLSSGLVSPPKPLLPPSSKLKSPVNFYRKRKKTVETSSSISSINESQSSVVAVSSTAKSSPWKSTERNSSLKNSVNSQSVCASSPKRFKLANGAVRNLAFSLHAPVPTIDAGFLDGSHISSDQSFGAASKLIVSPPSEEAANTPEISVVSNAPDQPSGAVMPSGNSGVSPEKPAVNRRMVWRLSFAKMCLK